jgi:transcriptional regulator of met regulon
LLNIAKVTRSEFICEAGIFHAFSGFQDFADDLADIGATSNPICACSESRIFFDLRY